MFDLKMDLQIPPFFWGGGDYLLKFYTALFMKIKVPVCSTRTRVLRVGRQRLHPMLHTELDTNIWRYKLFYGALKLPCSYIC